MRLKYELTFVEIGDDVMAVPVGSGADEFHGVIKVNRTAREILELIQNGNPGSDEVINSMTEKYPGDDPDTINNAVNEYIDKLNKAGLLVK